jgi:hypothetical protein
VLTQTLMRLARNGDVEGFRAYVRSDAFLAAFNGLHPGQRQSAMRCYRKAATMCEDKAAHPVVQPRPIARLTGETPMRAKLANAYARAGGVDEKAARILGVSLGSARLAKKRHFLLIAGHRQPPVLGAPQTASRAARWLSEAVERRPPVRCEEPTARNEEARPCT